MKHTLTLAALALSTAAFSQSFFDDFNRADGDPGANWVNMGGAPMTIMSNEITGSGTGNGLTLVDSGAFTGAFDTTVVQADLRIIDNSSTLAYAAVAIGHNGLLTTGQGIFVKLQRQVAGPNFSHIGIYTGNGINNTTAIVTAGGNFQALASPFAAARMTLRANSPTELYTGLDTDFNGTDEFSYTSTLNLGVLVLGDRVGMHFWGSLSRGDNFNANVVPEPATFAVLGLGALGLLLRRRK